MPTLTSSIIRIKSSKPWLLFPLLLSAALAAQEFPAPPRDTEPKRLPNGRLQSEQILKADYEANLKDLDRMKKLVDGIGEVLKKNDRHVLSIKALKDLDEIERIARRVRGRMRRY